MKVSLVLIFLVSLSLRLVPILRPGLDWARQGNVADSTGYVELAQGLETGCGFARRTALGCSAPEVLRTPGYPLFLAAFPDLRFAVAAQAVLGALISLFAGYAVCVQFGRNSGLLAAALIAMDVPSLVWASQVMSETVFTCLLTVSALLAWRLVWPENQVRRPVLLAWTSSAFLGLACLVKPIAMVLIPVVSAVIIVQLAAGGKRRLVCAVVFCCTPLLVVAGWTWRNIQTTGIWSFSTIGAKNLYFYRAAGVLQAANHWSVSQTQDYLNQNIQMPEGFSILSSGPVQRQSRTAIEEMTSRGRRVLLDHPYTFGKLTVLDLLYLLITPGLTDVNVWFGTAMDPTSNTESIRDKLGRLQSASKLILAVVLFYWGLLSLTYAGVAVALIRSLAEFRQRFPLIALPLLVAVALLVAAAGPEGGARLRVPAVPFLSVIGAVGLSWSFRSDVFEKRKVSLRQRLVCDSVKCL